MAINANTGIPAQVADGTPTPSAGVGTDRTTTLATTASPGTSPVAQCDIMCSS